MDLRISGNFFLCSSKGLGKICYISLACEGVDVAIWPETQSRRKLQLK